MYLAGSIFIASGTCFGRHADEVTARRVGSTLVAPRKSLIFPSQRPKFVIARRLDARAKHRLK
jgi:hypothetical protein